ncbi:MAG: hypothetical protein NXI26_27620 [bacterium]|jgi:hypothetical protein|uniref:hypothetical protein n=1 Tax=Phaeodactylibacter xiamenensis TaxID=1524460 RepID=UPI0005C57B94|nr:hypothetical protein [Phaeodactylibacter xiamenensis]MCR9055621.1 hypothetical protein [bacterium]
MASREIAEKIESGESFILADDGQYLGKLTLNKYDSESIMNRYGSYGSKYSSTSIYNQYGSYGSKYSSLSPYNKYTSTPPLIYLRGRKIGYLTKNKYVSLQAIDPDSILDWMKDNNLTY